MVLSLRQHLLLGFGFILVLFAGTSIYVTYETQKIQGIEHKLLDIRLPSVLTGEKLLDGIDLSLAGLRGYMILGKDPAKAKIFKAERAAGWEKIDNMLVEYDQLSQEWTDVDNLERLEAMKVLIEEFRQAQQEVENIAHDSKNIPALHLLLTKAAPKAKVIASSITKVINEESLLPATPERKALLKLLADSRGSFALGLASIRAYLLSGDTNFRKEFEQRWTINEERFKQISQQTYLFAGAQKAAWDDYAQNRAEFAPMPPEMFKLRSRNDWNKANHLLETKAAPRVQKIKVILAELAESQNALAAIDTESLYAEELRLEIISGLAAVISIIIGIGIALYYSHTISLQLKAMTRNAKRIAEGDLTVPLLKTGNIHDFNALATTLNTTKDNLNELVTRIIHSSDGLQSHSEKLHTLTTKSQGIIDKQEQETEQIATAMNQMSSTVKEVARNTTDAATSADEADRATSAGHSAVLETVDSINELAKGIEQAANTINQLGEETNDVDTILSTISGIADQTNLLALNAAIEAARAGEQGRGFAVVADEVRTLAARTQESTVEIRTMLDRLKSGATNAVDVMNKGHQQAQSSVEKAHSAKETLETITNTVNLIKDMNTQIATAAEEQSMVADEMSRNISNISVGAQDVVRQSHESLGSAQEMTSLANTLAESVAEFTVEGEVRVEDESDDEMPAEQ